MYNTIIYAIVVVMLAPTVVVAKPRNNLTNGQTREQYSNPSDWAGYTSSATP